jgi:4-aminobutyrate aminotransferase/(S)-3-amino-2-methylpropionate transaminase
MTEQTRPTDSNSDIEHQHGEYLMPIWKDLNVPVRRATDCTVEDFDGNEYLDVYSGIGVRNVGYGNEAVVDAAKEQLDDLVHSSTYVHPNKPAADLAERIAEISRDQLGQAVDGLRAAIDSGAA